MSDIVTFPLFVTANEYDTRSLTRDTVAGVALLTTDNAGACAIVTVPKEESPDTVRSGAVPPAGVGTWPKADPRPSIRPCSASACVTTYEPAVHVNVPPGANGCPAAGHVTVNAGPPGATN